MAKVYAVYSIYHEHDDLGEDIYSSENMEKLFDSMEKAINYICEQIKNDHKRVDDVYPSDQHLNKYIPNRKLIEQCRSVTSYEYTGLTYMLMNYRIEPYDVE